jgi:hypothetical protein
MPKHRPPCNTFSIAPLFMVTHGKRKELPREERHWITRTITSSQQAWELMASSIVNVRLEPSTALAPSLVSTEVRTRLASSSAVAFGSCGGVHRNCSSKRSGLPRGVPLDHTHTRASSEQVWEPMASSSAHPRRSTKKHCTQQDPCPPGPDGATLTRQNPGWERAPCSIESRIKTGIVDVGAFSPTPKADAADFSNASAAFSSSICALRT